MLTIATKAVARRMVAPATSAVITPTDTPKTKLPLEKLTFGTSFSDHMLEWDWTLSGGWGPQSIHKHQHLKLDPAAATLHYALECFEGMKAYKGPKGEIRLFRPELNMARMQRSMERLFLPTFEGDDLLDGIKELLRIDADWIPNKAGYSLYIRPTGISTHAFLGVGQSNKAKIFVITSPVGPYYPEGFKPVTLYATNKFTRAWEGGTGDTKIGGNYGPTIMPQIMANDKGYTQVLWLYGQKEQVTEVGTMNMFIFWVNEDGEKELVTASLDGTILPGVTRDSVLRLCRQWGEFKVSERTVFMNELTEASKAGRVLECFGVGTAAVVSPIRLIHHDGVDYDIPLDPSDASAGAGPLTKRLWDSLLDIQYGRVESDWSVVVDP